MLKNFHDISTDDCLVGLAIPGLVEENPKFQAIYAAIAESGYQQITPLGRPMTRLAHKLKDVVVESGWRIKYIWSQTMTFQTL